jgi:hypothetical protein
MVAQLDATCERIPELILPRFSCFRASRETLLVQDSG